LRAGLRVQDRTLHPAIPGARDERTQDGGPHAPPAPVAQHCHAADATVRKEPARCDRESIVVYRQRVIADGVPLVQLDAGRHALLFDEHDKPDAARLLARIDPAEESDGIVA